MIFPENMGAPIRDSFVNSSLVIDRFHVVRLAMDSVQHVRIKHRREAIDQENEAIAAAKKEGVDYEPKTFSNGDTSKQLLARSRYILAKKKKFGPPIKAKELKYCLTNTHP